MTTSSVSSSYTDIFEIIVNFDPYYKLCWDGRYGSEANYVISSAYLSSAKSFPMKQLQRLNTDIPVPYNAPMKVTVTGGICDLTGYISVGPTTATAETYAPIAYPTRSPAATPTKLPTRAPTIGSTHSDASKTAMDTTTTVGISVGVVAAAVLIVAFVVYIMHIWKRPVVTVTGIEVTNELRALS